MDWVVWSCLVLWLCPFVSHTVEGTGPWCHHKVRNHVTIVYFSWTILYGPELLVQQTPQQFSSNAARLCRVSSLRRGVPSVRTNGNLRVIFQAGTNIMAAEECCWFHVGNPVTCSQLDELERSVDNSPNGSRESRREIGELWPPAKWNVSGWRDFDSCIA